MIDITLPDGSVKTFDKNVTPMDVAKSISEGLARNVISASFNNTTIEKVIPTTENNTIAIILARETILIIESKYIINSNDCILFLLPIYLYLNELLIWQNLLKTYTTRPL